jgi:uncharacterized Zn finger protein
MQCQRCDGMMTMEGVWTREGNVVMARCVYCGNVVDPVVVANRARSRASLASMLEKEAQEEGRTLQETGVFSPREVSRRHAA